LTLTDRETVVNSVLKMFVVSVTCLKHEGFHEEREWRAIYGPKRLHSPLMTSSTEVVAGVPQFVYQLPLDARVSDALSDLDLAKIFDRLIIGPSQYPHVMKEAFEKALAAAGVKVDRYMGVYASGIPIRS
jgi:hypothetical protein